MSRRAKTGSLLLLACAVTGAAAIHRATHGRWFPRRPAAIWPARAVATTPTTLWAAWNPIPIGQRIEGVWGRHPDDVWAWNVAGMMHWDGLTWTRVARPPRTLAGVDAIAGTPAGFVLRAKRYHQGRDGGWCQSFPSYVETSHWCRIGDRWERGICVTAAGGGVTATIEDSRFTLPAQLEADLVGRDELARLWASHGDRGSLPSLDLQHGWRVGGGEIWAVDKDDLWLLRFDGHRWTGAAHPLGRDGGAGVWFASENDGWAVGGQKISHWDGRDWTPLPPKTPGSVGSIWGTAADDVWVVGGSGSGLVMHYDGRDWRARPFPDWPWLASVTGRARDDVWVTGCDKTGFAAHWDGSGWTQFSIAPPGQDLYGRIVCPMLVPARDGRTLAAVEGSMFLFAPLTDRWRAIDHPLSGYLGGPRWGPGEFAAFAAGPGAEFWGVGKRYGAREDERSPVVLRHAAGDKWTKGDLPADWGSASAVWRRAADDVWVVGTAGLILHFDGRTWTQEPSGTDEALVGVHGAGRTIWVIGAEGGLYRRSL